MVKQVIDLALSDQTDQPASAGFFTPAFPQEGGSYIRDPETGELTKVEVNDAVNP